MGQRARYRERLVFFAVGSSLTPEHRSGMRSARQPVVPNWEEESGAEPHPASLIPIPRELTWFQLSTRSWEGRGGNLKLRRAVERHGGGDAPGSRGPGRKVRKSEGTGMAGYDTGMAGYDPGMVLGDMAGRWRGAQGSRAFPVSASLQRTLETNIFELMIQTKGFFPSPPGRGKPV